MSTKTTTPAAQATESTEQKKDWGHIKSYVHRSVHMTPSQKKALEGERSEERRVGKECR